MVRQVIYVARSIVIDRIRQGYRQKQIGIRDIDIYMTWRDIDRYIDIDRCVFIQIDIGRSRQRYRFIDRWKQIDIEAIDRYKQNKQVVRYR